MITSPNVESTNDLMNSSRGSGTPPWLYHTRPTMAARAWPKTSPRQLEDLRQSSASSRCFSCVSAALWWMDGSSDRRRKRQFIDKHLGQKGDANRDRISLGRPSWADWPRPIFARFGPVSLPNASRSIVDLLPYACGPLTSSSPQFGQSSLSRKLQHLLSRSLEFHGFMLRSLDPLESCSWCVLTCVGLHDRLLKCLMNLSRKYPFKL
jgi:hypothetical protein